MILEPGTKLSFEVTEALSIQSRCRIAKIEPLENGNTRLTIEAEAVDRPELVRDMILVLVQASDGKTYKEKFPVVFDHHHRISAIPRHGLFFRTRDTKPLLQPKAEPLRRDIQLYASTPDLRFRVTRVEWLDLPEGVFEAEVHPIKAGERYRISVFLRAHQNTPLLRGRMVVHTDHPELPVREFSIHAQFDQTSKPGSETSEASSPGHR